LKPALPILAFLIVAAFHAVADPTPAQEAAFLTRVEQAFTKKDAPALLSLYCFDHTEPKLRQQTEKQLIPELLKHDYSTAELVPLPPDLATPYTLRGVTYAPNLKPLKALIIRFKKSSPATPDNTTMIVGMKDSSLAFALAAPTSTP
jgi:hypothetical protein